MTQFPWAGNHERLLRWVGLFRDPRKPNLPWFGKERLLPLIWVAKITRFHLFMIVANAQCASIRDRE